MEELQATFEDAKAELNEKRSKLVALSQVRSLGCRSACSLSARGLLEG